MPRRNVSSLQSVCDDSCCLRPTDGGSASGAREFRGHLWVHLRYGPVTRSPSFMMALSVGFIRFVSSSDATQASGFLTFAPVGLSPTEHASLRWTHIRFSCFSSSGIEERTASGFGRKPAETRPILPLCDHFPVTPYRQPRLSLSVKEARPRQSSRPKRLSPSAD